MLCEIVREKEATQGSVGLEKEKINIKLHKKNVCIHSNP